MNKKGSFQSCLKISQCNIYLKRVRKCTGQNSDKNNSNEDTNQNKPWDNEVTRESERNNQYFKCNKNCNII